MVNPIDKLVADSHVKGIEEAFEFSADALERLEELRWYAAAVERMIDEAVLECRTNAVANGVDVVEGETRQTQIFRPVSWRRIGDALGMTGQSAHQRFKHLI